MVACLRSVEDSSDWEETFKESFGRDFNCAPEADKHYYCKDLNDAGHDETRLVAEFIINERGE